MQARAALITSEADKLTLQGELKGADGLLESARTENRALQGKPYTGKLIQFVEV
jgi:hypothetical protein